MTERSKRSGNASPIDSGYPNCKETHAELRIYLGSGLAGDVAKRLGIEPTETQDADEVVENSTSRNSKASSTGWFLSSEGQVDSKELVDHVDWLLAKLAGAESALLGFQEQRDTKMTVACVWWSADGHGGPYLKPAQMRALAGLNLECSFDVYFQGNLFGPGFDDYAWHA